MKKRLLLLSILSTLSFAQKTLSMMDDAFGLDFNIDTFRTLYNMADDSAQAARRRYEERKIDEEQSFQQRLNELKEQKERASSPEEKIEITRQIGKLHENRDKINQKREELEHKACKMGLDMLNTAGEIVKDQFAAPTKMAQEYINAKFRKEAFIEGIKEIVKELKEPKVAIIPTLIAAGVFGSWHGSKIVANQIQKYLNKIPTIAEETSLVSVKDKIINYLKGQKAESNINDVILESNLADRISRIATSVKNTVSNGGYFRHILFYGPPGTGKTMLAKRIARSSGLEYIYFAGGSALDQLPIEDALARLVELFEFAKRSSKKLMIIIDEAEVLLANRSKNLSDKTRKLLNLILGYTGTETNNFIIVALTNRPEDLDDAFLSRCDEQIEIGAPAPEQRLEILQSYIKKFLTSRTKEQPKPSLFVRLLGANNPPKPIKIEKDALTQEVIEDIAQRLEHFVGRDISKLVISIQSEAYATPQCLITKEIVDRVVQQKIDQKTLEKKQFKK